MTTAGMILDLSGTLATVATLIGTHFRNEAVGWREAVKLHHAEEWYRGEYWVDEYWADPARVDEPPFSVVTSPWYANGPVGGEDRWQ